MTDRELIEKLQEEDWGTELIVVDDKGNEYYITGISLTMGGCEHQVIELKKVPFKDHWFRTIGQQIKDSEKDLRAYRKMLKTKKVQSDEKYKNMVELVIKQTEQRIEQLKEQKLEKI